MRRPTSRAFGLALAIGGMLLFAGSGVRADMVTYITSGSFSGGDAPGSSTYSDSANGISIVFNSSGANTVSVPPTSLVSFGQFNTSATSATSLKPVTTGFTLNIFETGPDSGALNFLGSLTGSLQVSGSTTYVQFTGPLSGSIGNALYSIVSADSGVMGRVNIAPPTTNNGLSTIAGQVGLVVVPEPSSLAMLAMGGSVALIGLRFRHRMQVATIA